MEESQLVATVNNVCNVMQWQMHSALVTLAINNFNFGDEPVRDFNVVNLTVLPQNVVKVGVHDILTRDERLEPVRFNARNHLVNCGAANTILVQWEHQHVNALLAQVTKHDAQLTRLVILLKRVGRILSVSCGTGSCD